MILIHECCHILAGYFLGFKILDFKLYKVDNPPLYNSYIMYEHRKYDWKWSVVLYAPAILILPIILFFVHPIFLFIGIYFLSTTIFHNGKPLFLFLPSSADLKYKIRVNYYSYLVENSSYEEFNYYLKTRRLKELISKYHLLTEREYFFEKK